jgi:TonB family protein
MNPTILAQPQISLRKQFSTGSGAPPPNRVVLKPLPGKPGTTARFSMLPQTRTRFGAIGASMTLQAGLLALIIIVPLVFPQKMIPQLAFNVMPLTAPLTEVPVPPKPPVVKPKPQPVVVQPVEEAVVPPPPQPRIIAPRNVAPKVQPKTPAQVDAPKVDAPIVNPKLDLNVAAPPRPRPPVVTDNFNTGSAAAPTLPKTTDPSKVQTGGFGDPNGVSGPSNPNVRANVNGRGSFDLPPGPGYGNGTGGANGARGTIASTGFGNGTAIPPTGGGGRRGGTVQSGGFTQATVDTENRPKQQQTQAAAVQPIVLLEKPKPQYTQEARDAHIEGTVDLNVIFKANGEIQVLGVIKGLGHGLDEMAIQAAKKIKYKPAISNGQPVDFPATAHIEFLLAY